MACALPEITPLERPAYQRAVRLLLRHPLVTESYPDGDALALLRRWAAHLRADLADQLGYRVEITATTARLIRTADTLDPSRPARPRPDSDRTFDRRRYAYLALALAALGRSGGQIALGELATAVAADAARVDGLGLSTQSASDRAAFVDAIAWIETRGGLRLADGNARRWADDPDRAEALYDVDRDVIGATYRPSRVLQHVRSVDALLHRSDSASRDPRRREAAQRARRAVIETPVAYYADADADMANMLRTSSLVSDVERLTGCPVERRAEGLALLDTTQRFSDLPFPSGGTVPQAALLLAGAIADRITDPDQPAPTRLPEPGPAAATAEVAAQIDLGLPVAGILTELAEPATTPAAALHAAGPDGVDDARPEHPLLQRAWLRTTMLALGDRYGPAFSARWRADPERLLGAALDLLADLRMVAVVEGGVLALPLLARYRNTVATLKRRPSLLDGALFDLGAGGTHDETDDGADNWADDRADNGYAAARGQDGAGE
ncbi:MAG: TIGR02678 family protein [Mycobacteriales bacterium]